MKRGTKPKPTAAKRARGNPGCRQLNEREPEFAKGAPDAPEWLPAEARVEWDRVTGELVRTGVLALIHRSTVAAYCCYWAEFAASFGTGIDETDASLLRRRERAAIQMRQFAGELGITPSSQSRIVVGQKTDEQRLDDFIAAKPLRLHKGA